MDPINRGPEEYGRDGDHRGEGEGSRRPSRDPLTPEFGQPRPAPARTVELISGDFLLTVNPVDGSEIEPCPPGEQPAPPVRHGPEDRADLDRAAGPALPPGPAAPPLPLLERQEEHERLVGLLSRGRSVRLTGAAGSGRTCLLDAVAADCADLAPDGVVRLNGHRRTPTELLYELAAAVFSAPRRRLDRAGLLELVHDIGAVVVLDDLEFGGDALEELLDATPECAFLFAATPDVAAPHAESHLEEVALGGLGRSASIELLERAVERPLTDEEANWAGDLWFESEGLPLRFVQAGALLRQRDERRAGPEDGDGYGSASDLVDEAFSAFGGARRDEPLPTLGEGAAPAPLLASRLGEAARQTLRFAVALGGEVPHQAHLPALIGDTHADTAIGELLACGLLSPAGQRYRLAAGAVEQLAAAGYDEDAVERAHTAAQHYAWWAGHPSVTPERAAAEADAVLAALGTTARSQEAGHASSAVLLARSAAPAFAAGLHWGAWERALRGGQEAARVAGEVAEEAYFHHELGILALCSGQLDRARAELETSIGMRGVLADKRGTVAGRRALALVTDRSGGLVVGGRTPAGEEVPAARYEESASPPGGTPAVTPFTPPAPPDEIVTVMTPQVVQPEKKRGARFGGRLGLLGGARRNLVAAGAGVLLAAVLGTAVTIGATSGGEKPPTDKVKTGQSVGEEDGGGGLDADEPTQDSTDRPGGGGDGGTGGGTGGSGDGGTDGPGPSSDATKNGDGGAATGGTTGGSPSPTTGGTSTGTGTSGTNTGTGGTQSGGTNGGSTNTGGTDTGGPTTGDPTTGGPTTGDPTTGGPTTGDPTTGGPTTGDPTTGGPTTGDPTTGGPTTGDPTTGGPTTGGNPAGGGSTGTSTGPTTQGGTTASTASAGGTTTGPSSPGASSSSARTGPTTAA
ncbi:ATP-binding protein [Streptomyces sp. NPDC050504]|uniref:ATP-binding protein n=1 Tax=Streptomyces sp. NPDC050504 TaxID=3365618 RepID=UPI0037A6941D